MANNINESAIKKLKLLFTVVDRPKAEFYLDFISQFEVNCQMVLSGQGNKMGGTISCYLATGHNATDVALFFGDADACIIGDQPFATAAVDNQTVAMSVSVGFVDVVIPEDADYILAYSYSDTLGWSKDCEVFALEEFADSSESMANGNASPSGKVKSDKKNYKLGDWRY